MYKKQTLEQACLFDDNPEYDSFVAKFEPKKNTDDCYTPPLVYAAIRDWVCDRYDIDPACIVRPFFPGGDFVNYDYPEGCLVLDNPPFSILSEICKFYLAKDIPYFLVCSESHSFWRANRRNSDEPHHLRRRYYLRERRSRPDGICDKP